MYNMYNSLKRFEESGDRSIDRSIAVQSTDGKLPGVVENYKTPFTEWDEGKKKKEEEEDSRKWRTWSVKNRGQFRDNQVFPRFLRGSASKRAVLERRRSTTSHPPRFSLTFYFENGTETSFPIPSLTRRPPTSSTLSPLLRPPDTHTRDSLEKNSRGEERRGIAWKQTREIKARHWRSLDGADYFYDVTRRRRRRRRDGCPEDEMPQPPSISRREEEEKEEEKSFAGRPLRCRWQLLPSRDRNTVRFRLPRRLLFLAFLTLLYVRGGLMN